MGKIGALATTWVIWGTTYLAIKLALVDLPPLLLTSIRFLLAGILLAAISRPRISAPLRQWLSALLSGSLLFLIGMGGVAIAEQKVASGTTALVIATVPLWSALIGFATGRWPHVLDLAGIVAGTTAIALLAAGTAPFGSLLILLVSALAWALGSFTTQRLPAGTGTGGAALEMICGGALLLLAGLASGESKAVRMPGITSTAALLYLVVFGSAVVLAAYKYLLRTTTPVIATSYAYVSPLVAVASGALLLDEELTSTHALAAALVVLAVVLSSAGSRRTARISQGRPLGAGLDCKANARGNR